MHCSLTPCAVDWKIAADWFAGSTSLLVGIAVVFMAWRTNAIAEAARKVTEAMADHERRLSEQAQRLLEEERRLLLVSLAMPAAFSYAKLSVAVRWIEAVGHKWMFVTNRPPREELLQLLTKVSFDLPESIRERLHLLGNPLAARIVRLQSLSEPLLEIVRLTIDDEEAAKAHLQDIFDIMKAWEQEIDIVHKACQVAVTECGLEELTSNLLHESTADDASPENLQDEQAPSETS